MAFNQTEYFNGELYKLATPRGVDKKTADKTVEINKAEQNKVKLIEKNGEYAVYVKKLTWKEMV